jgi:hypothetical protein
MLVAIPELPEQQQQEQQSQQNTQNQQNQQQNSPVVEETSLAWNMDHARHSLPQSSSSSNITVITGQFLLPRPFYVYLYVKTNLLIKFSMKMIIIIYGVKLCSLIEIYLHFRIFLC